MNSIFLTLIVANVVHAIEKPACQFRHDGPVRNSLSHSINCGLQIKTKLKVSDRRLYITTLDDIQLYYKRKITRINHTLGNLVIAYTFNVRDILIHYTVIYLCLCFKFSIELQNDLGEVETSFVFIVDFYTNEWKNGVLDYFKRTTEHFHNCREVVKHEPSGHLEDCR